MHTPGGTRTHNLALRRGTPYPLGHGGAFMLTNPGLTVWGTGNKSLGEGKSTPAQDRTGDLLRVKQTS